MTHRRFLKKRQKLWPTSTRFVDVLLHDASSHCSLSLQAKESSSPPPPVVTSPAKPTTTTKNGSSLASHELLTDDLFSIAAPVSQPMPYTTHNVFDTTVPKCRQRQSGSTMKADIIRLPRCSELLRRHSPTDVHIDEQEHQYGSIGVEQSKYSTGRQTAPVR